MGYSPSAPENELTTKGDLEVATGPGGTVRLPAGGNGMVLMTDSTQSAGLKWASSPAGSAPAWTAKTASYTASNLDAVGANAAAGALTVTLPAAAANAVVWVKKIDTTTTNAVTVLPASGTIDGATSVVLNTPYAARQFISDGTNWWIL